MKVYSAQQIYEADRATIKNEQISSGMLMERASLELFNWLNGQLNGAQVSIHIFAGIGNNGGDGLALARHLKDHGYTINVHVVNYSEKRSEDFLINLDQLKERKVWPDFINEHAELPQIKQGDILIDAIFGIGLNRPPADWVGRLIEHLNSSGGFRVSVDVPSGLFADRDTLHKHIIKSDMVLTFQAPKLIFFLPLSGRFCEHWEVLDIALDAEYLSETETRYELVTRETIIQLYRPRDKFSHKGNYGHSLIVGGSYGKMGAVQLSAKACLHSGSGLVTAFVPSCGYLPLQTAVPEVMVLTDTNDDLITGISYELAPDAIGIGIGMGTAEATAAAFSKFLDSCQSPLVVDADGINIIAQNKGLLKKLPPQTVLTPHPGELQRLIGPWQGDFEKLKKAHDFCSKYDCVLLLKGAHTITLYNGKGYINNSGNPGMATAGSGDILTGIITGLIAQGYSPLHASIFGAFIHGRAGDIGAAHNGYEALTAGQITESLGLAFIDLLSNEDKTEAE